MSPSLKRKSNPRAPHTPSKRLRTDGLFTPRVKAPTGASRSIPRASRYQPSSASPAKRTLDEEHVEQGLSSKVRILNNRECLYLLPSRKSLPVPVPALQRKVKPRSPVKDAIIARLSRRRAILLRKQKLERMMERMDSDNVYYFSEGLSDNIKLFTSRSPASFSSFSVEIADLDMDIEEPTGATTITSDSPSQSASDPESLVEEKIETDAPEEGATKKSGDADEELVRDPGSKPEERKEEEKDSMKDAEAEPEEEVLMKDDEAEEKKEDVKEASETLSTMDKLVSDRVKERLGEDGMICLNVKTKKVGEEESTAARKSPIKKKVKVVLPPTLEEEDEEEKELESPKKRNSRPSGLRKKREEADDSSDSEREDREEKPRRRSSRSSVRKKYEDSNPSDTEKDGDKREEEGEEATTHPDKMEEDADADAESTGSSGEDTDMSTDDEAPTETTEEEDVAMSEDGDDSGDSRDNSDEKKEDGGERQEKEDEADNEDNGEPSTLIKTDSKTSDEEVRKPKRVKALTLSSQHEEAEAVSTLKTPSSAASLRYNYSITKTPKSPRSPRLFKHDLVPSSPLSFSSFGKKKKALLKTEIERDASLWMLGRSSGLYPKRRRQLPFNPANVSRHAYRDSDSDDGEDMYTHHHHGFQSSRWETDEAEDDDVYLHVGWPWDGRGCYNPWMMEHGATLLEFCVRKLEGFNMAW
ncbi:unnamed protein product [Tuber melanosporum]|uniref:(Perigord truffle) hypothetical protein n=1 Tax=Tuber melanosporum (strain Mel28) TaxID=656061 RepID=D5GAU5_TUBMM|nr:uncharacterized protein GSTUM_00005311001 [Tuber melanosporum]CAZ81638.1 unnamed protein product [Tuber melanosporum]